MMLRKRGSWLWRGGFGLCLVWIVVVLSCVSVLGQTPPGGSDEGGDHDHVYSDAMLADMLNTLVLSGTQSSEGLLRHLMMLEMAVTIFLAGFGGVIVLVQVQANRRVEERLGKFEDEGEVWRARTEKGISDFVAREMNRFVGKEIERIFQGVYEEKIARYVRDLGEEVLTLSPSARGSLLARLQRLNGEIGRCLPDGGSKAPDLVDVLSKAAQDWHALGQLHSLDKEEIKRGLFMMIESPFPEGRTQLLRLRGRFAEDSDVLPLVNQALEPLGG